MAFETTSTPNTGHESNSATDTSTTESDESAPPSDATGDEPTVTVDGEEMPLTDAVAELSERVQSNTNIVNGMIDSPGEYGHAPAPHVDEVDERVSTLEETIIELREELTRRSDQLAELYAHVHALTEETVEANARWEYATVVKDSETNEIDVALDPKQRGDADA
jgi:uncharacterized coiled-coil protein SlyX